MGTGVVFCFFTYLQLIFPLLFFHFTFASLTSMQPLCHDDERSALLQFKQSLVIDHSASDNPFAYPKVASWNLEEENNDCCSWDGIKCDEDTGHVIELDLGSSCLHGSINSSSRLFHLTHLQWLSLADNNFNCSKIPSGIMNLSKLSHLNLSGSFFSGQIPSELLEISKLVSFDISKNFLELQNPSLRSLVEKLVNLKVLDLSEVKISSSVPHILTNSSSLTSLSLRDCDLQGEFPSEIFHLPNICILDVTFNPSLKGYLPEFHKSSSLEKLALASTGFSGEIPDSIGNLKSLSYLNISDIIFSGTIPSSIGNLSKLVILDLSYNNFLGGLPASFGNLRSLEKLDGKFGFSLGQVPTSLGNLTQLNYLDLSGVELSGEIPNWLMNLTQLSELYMCCNQLKGSIPYWLMNLNQLSSLKLFANELNGHIPSHIGNLTHLYSLQLSLNQFQGPIPNSISELKNLEILDLYSNRLSGTVDLEMVLLKLKRLNILNLSLNNLSLLIKTSVVNTYPQKFRIIGLGSSNLGEFPVFLHNQDQLQWLDLSSNKIAGKIPRWFLNVSRESLKLLNLSSNFLTRFDHHPVVLPWRNLLTLDLRSNMLQGPLPVPPVFSSHYLASNNMLTGKIPPWICDLGYLLTLNLAYNNLSGTLPECLANLSSLWTLDLRGNKFHGSIPETFLNGTDLRMIDLSHNLLQGRIPRSLINCTRLKFLHLGNNQIVDVFPSWLGTLPQLEVLILKSNMLYGTIKEPETYDEFAGLRIIDLSHNKFTGEFPSKYFSCWNAMNVVYERELTYMEDELLPMTDVPSFDSTYYGFYYYSLTMSNKGIEIEYGKISTILTGIILSHNSFIGEIPTSIANLTGLHALDLSNNNFSGHIPSQFGNLTSLESLDLSSNRLTGKIPQQLVELTYLAFFDVSNNNLTGSIPQGKQFGAFENSSFDGNPRLCGEPLSRKCENSEAAKQEDPASGSESLLAFGWKIVLIGYASGTVIGVVLGHIFHVRKHEWLAKNFGLQPKTKYIQRKRPRRNSWTWEFFFFK